MALGVINMQMALGRNKVPPLVGMVRPMGRAMPAPQSRGASAGSEGAAEGAAEGGGSVQTQM